jgi:hypothetical protein
VAWFGTTAFEVPREGAGHPSARPLGASGAPSVTGGARRGAYVTHVMRSRAVVVALSAALALTACIGVGGPPWFIPGSARLPSCSEAPAADLTGGWFDQGLVTITSPGCLDAPLGTALPACALDWDVAQDGTEVAIVVDEEYEIRGRLCGDTLHLEGGWWLPVEAEGNGCTYDDEDASEVGIEAEGAALTYADGAMSGTLAIRADCTAEYAVTLRRRP